MCWNKYKNIEGMEWNLVKVIEKLFYLIPNDIELKNIKKRVSDYMFLNLCFPNKKNGKVTNLLLILWVEITNSSENAKCVFTAYKINCK